MKNSIQKNNINHNSRLARIVLLAMLCVSLVLSIMSFVSLANSTSANISNDIVDTKGTGNRATLEYLEQERARLRNNVKVFAYMPSWGVYGGHEHFDVDKDIDYSRVTHVSYSFVKPIDLDKKLPDNQIKHDNQHVDDITVNTTNFGVRFDDPDAALNLSQPGPWNTQGDILNRIRNNLSRYPDRYFVYSVGGWTYSENDEFEKATSTPARMEQFSQSLVDFMQQYNFDGIDIDWEYPENDTTAQQYLDLHRIVREKLTELGLRTGRYYQLSCATTPRISKIQYIKPKEIIKYVDTVNYMAYDYSGGSFGLDTMAGHNAPLYKPSIMSQKDEADGLWIDATIKAYLAQGVPPEQLLMGIPYYSRSWIGIPDTELVAGLPGMGGLATQLPAEGGESDDDGKFIQNSTGGMWGNGSNPYYRMEDLLAGTPTSSTWQDTNVVTWMAKDYKRYWDNSAKVPYLYSKTDKIYHSYDDAESVGIKVDYIMDNKLGGAVVWDLSGDTRNGNSTSPAFEIGKVVGRLVGKTLGNGNGGGDNGSGGGNNGGGNGGGGDNGNGGGNNNNDVYISTNSLIDGQVGSAYFSSVSASGVGPFTFTLGTGSPNWLNISNDGFLYGTPNQAGSGIRVVVQVVGANGAFGQKEFAINIKDRDGIMPPAQSSGSGGSAGWIIASATTVALCAGGAGVYVWSKRRASASIGSRVVRPSTSSRSSTMSSRTRTPSNSTKRTPTSSTKKPPSSRNKGR